MLKNAEKRNYALAALLAASVLLRFALAAATEGYPYDTGCFFAWALRMAEVGPGAFYTPDYFCDYPPAYLLALWLVGKGMKLLRLNYLQKTATLLLVTVPVLCDAAIAAVLYRLARPRGRQLALHFAAAAAFCPVLLFDTAVWKQIDSVFALCILLCFALLCGGKYRWAAMWYGLALAVKPQALLVGPVLAVCFLYPLWGAKNARLRVAALRNGLLGVLCALGPVVLCGLPFWGVRGLYTGLTEKYFATATSYPYATINAFNFMAFLGGSWKPQEGNIYWYGTRLALTWQQLGMVLLAALTVLLVVLALRACRNGCFDPLLLAAVYAVGVFTFSHRMHERYLVFGVVLLAAAAARLGAARLLLMAGGLSVTGLLNLAVVYSTVGTDDEFLTGATSVLMTRLTGLAATLLCVLLLWEAWRLCGGAQPQRLALPELTLPEPPAPQPPWTKKEALRLAALTLAAAVVSFAYLGERTAPQTGVNANGGSAYSTVALSAPATELWVYPGITTYNNGTVTVRDADGAEVVTLNIVYTSVFTWQRVNLNGCTAYTVEFKDCQLMELSFRDEEGRPLTAQAEPGTPLLDEQEKVPARISQLNSFYFDEIYHARTGYESLHGMRIYETTHPPLGKDLIALGIAIFGMTGFGWRFFGTLAGVLMVPALYLLVRRLTRAPQLALWAAALLSLDFMRFTQSRIATIDSFVSLFILLGAYCLVWFGQTVPEKGVGGALLPMALGGVAFGLGVASKWTGLYAGVGLAVCYFGTLYRRGRQLCAQKQEEALKKEVALALAGGVVFYVLVPLGIYVLSYWPYKLHDPGFGLRELWQSQQYMYRYHSGLEASHSFSSSWYAWPLDLRPVWYYMGGGLPAGRYASIAGMFSPLVCWGGCAAVLALCGRLLVGKASSAQKGVLVFYFSQLLPWLLVTRCTFLYHYMPCLAFLVAAMALCMAELEKKKPKAARWARLAALVAAAVLFVWFYPALSGLPVGRMWAKSLKWLPSWGFYIL